MDEKDIRFVASRYRQGAFSTEKAWRRLGFETQSWWTKSKIAAAVACLVFLSVSAALVVQRHYEGNAPATKAVNAEESEPSMDTVSVLDFDNAPLTEIVAEIQRVYGVEVSNLPEDASTYNLTIHYEGNACELVERINELLGTNLEIVN